jgi:hypothetical protein
MFKKVSREILFRLSDPVKSELGRDLFFVCVPEILGLLKKAHTQILIFVYSSCVFTASH